MTTNTTTTKNIHYAEEIRVRGIVQGVGFRPTVWRLAQQSHLTGTVCNDGDGVLISVQGTRDAIEHFIHALKTEAPKLARIDSIEEHPQGFPVRLATEFKIIHSANTAANTGVTADAATCKECLDDIFDQNNRRFLYPFTNCTHCGPRLSIIQRIPYDRANTSMAEFTMCPECQQEYQSPTDRRFHAQPNACPVCGPEIWLEDSSGSKVAPNEQAITQTAEYLRNGAIVAIKGIGGIHLAVDASNANAVERLRKRKQRPRKAFALMAKDSETVKRYCEVSDTEKDLLESTAAPIVLLQKRKDIKLSDGIAPGQNTLGFMLPYTPLHHLLMKALGHPIVLTSGNTAHEPQCIDNQDARQRLHPIADYFLLHNRAIENRVDDSVMRLMGGKPQFLRRARGYAPEALNLPTGFSNAPEILALGGELKNTFCLIKNGQAILSQHMGDLENYSTYEDYRHNLSLYENLFQHRPEHLAIDAHPEYISNKTGQEIANQQGISLQTISHHHAHIASCLADNGYGLDAAPVLGIALDGLGYGEDDTLWGGEFLLADYQQSERLAHFKPVALLGGSIAMKQPWRNTYTHLQSCLGWDWVSAHYGKLDLIQQINQKPVQAFHTMLEKGMNCPLASSAGRLFDAVAAATGICREEIQYEGQAAIELEACIDKQAWMDATASPYIFSIDSNMLDPTPMWKSLLDDLSNAAKPSFISARFHKGLSLAIQQLAASLANEHSLSTVALSGGVFQNKTLFEDVKQGLKEQGFKVLCHQNVPANDGGIALGQAVIAAARACNKT